MLAHVEAECKAIIPGQGHWTDEYFLYLRYLEIKLKIKHGKINTRKIHRSNQ
jgi:hypothetical protein